jgi:hypothetical protein
MKTIVCTEFLRRLFARKPVLDFKQKTNQYRNNHLSVFCLFILQKRICLMDFVSSIVDILILIGIFIKVVLCVVVFCV